MVYLRSIHIENVKLIRDLTLSFERDGQPRMWTVLIGENGVCKTTVLQAVALAASGGGPLGNRLAASTPALPDARRPEADAHILASFHLASELRGKRVLKPPSGSAPELRSELWMSSESRELRGHSRFLDVDGEDASTKEVLDPLKLARSYDNSGWLVVGYGVNRLLPQPLTTTAPPDVAFDRIDPLFSQMRTPIGIGFADFFDPKWTLAMAKTLRHLVLAAPGLLPQVTDVELRGRGGLSKKSDWTDAHRFVLKLADGDLKLPSTWLSQGYQSTIAWVADLVGHMYLDHGGPVKPAEMRGLVLIDEVDLHLHPAWQAGLVQALKTVFPNIQFIATTHSPMVLPGLEPDEIIKLRLDDEGNVVREPVDERPALMTGTQIYQRYFGAANLYLTEVGQALNEHAYLAGNPHRSDEDERRLAELAATLDRHGVAVDWPVAPRERG